MNPCTFTYLYLLLNNYRFENLVQMMWALEYDPELCSLYAADPEAQIEKSDESKGKSKSKKQFGKYERENLKIGGKGAETPLPISVFLVASVLKEKSPKLIEARGLDDVVKVSKVIFCYIFPISVYITSSL